MALCWSQRGMKRTKISTRFSNFWTSLSASDCNQSFYFLKLKLISNKLKYFSRLCGNFPAATFYKAKFLNSIGAWGTSSNSQEVLQSGSKRFIKFAKSYKLHFTKLHITLKGIILEVLEIIFKHGSTICDISCYSKKSSSVWLLLKLQSSQSCECQLAKYKYHMFR